MQIPLSFLTKPLLQIQAGSAEHFVFPVDAAHGTGKPSSEHFWGSHTESGQNSKRSFLPHSGAEIV